MGRREVVGAMHDRDIHAVMRLLGQAAPRWPVPALAHYSRTPFTTLISCVLSLRTQDRATFEASGRLFAVASTPDELARLPRRRIERLIYPVSFYRVKSKTVGDLAREIRDRFDGQVPDTVGELVTLKGVGRKTANIVVTLGYGKPGIAVDTHVHRIANRLGYVASTDPDKTEILLRAKLPRRYWIVLNDLLVAFGQNLCRPVSPHCSLCPIADYCDRVGVLRSR
jgi:endonuclease-3